MDISVQLEGFEELERLLTQLPVRVERRILIAGLRAAAKPIKRQARANIKANFKTDTGTLLRSIRHRTAKGGLKKGALLFVEAMSGPRAKVDAYYARFLEMGTKYITAHPFLANALESTREQALDAFDEAVIKQIDIEVAKLR